MVGRGWMKMPWGQQDIFQIFGMLAGSLWCQLSPAVGKVPLCAIALPVCQATIENVHSFSAPSHQCIFPSPELRPLRRGPCVHRRSLAAGSGFTVVTAAANETRCERWPTTPHSCWPAGRRRWPLSSRRALARRRRRTIRATAAAWRLATKPTPATRQQPRAPQRRRPHSYIAPLRWASYTFWHTQHFGRQCFSGRSTEVCCCNQPVAAVLSAPGDVGRASATPHHGGTYDLVLDISAPLQNLSNTALPFHASLPRPSLTLWMSQRFPSTSPFGGALFWAPFRGAPS